MGAARGANCESVSFCPPRSSRDRSHTQRSYLLCINHAMLQVAPRGGAARGERGQRAGEANEGKRASERALLLLSRVCMYHGRSYRPADYTPPPEFRNGAGINKNAGPRQEEEGKGPGGRGAARRCGAACFLHDRSICTRLVSYFPPYLQSADHLKRHKNNTKQHKHKTHTQLGIKTQTQTQTQNRPPPPPRRRGGGPRPVPRPRLPRGL